jgi:S1-C subfamily serine protease
MNQRAPALTIAGILLMSLWSATVPAADPPAAPPEAASVPAPESSLVGQSVVKVFSTQRAPDLLKPWGKQAPVEVSGSGVVIEGNRILTNAHVVLYATQVQIQGHQAGDKLSATVEAISPGIDLAILKLDDPSFFKTHPPLLRADKLPNVTDTVLTYGYPIGGTSLSITKGIVSRIEFTVYTFPVSGLKIQVDSAINAGNSGGPVVVGDQMIGLAFSRLIGNAQNIGYIIPNEEIDLFLKEVATGNVEGKPGLYDDFQTLENPALRAYLKLDPAVQGLVVNQPYRGNANDPLRQWDVVTAIGDTPVDDQGMIKIGEDLRVDFRYRVQQVARNGKVPLTVVRAGKTLQLEAPVSADRPLLIGNLKGDYPPYFIYGPLVFSRLTQNYANTVVQNTQQASNLAYYRSPLMIDRGLEPTAERDELVVVSSPFFPDALARGYSQANGSVVRSINDLPVRNLKQLVALLRDLKDEFVVVKFDRDGGETLVFRRAELVAQTDHILDDNGVRAQGSPELMAVWQGKAK